MTPDMAHDEARTLLGAETLGALSDEEQAGLLAHVASCEACRRELAALGETAGLLAEGAPDTPLDPIRLTRARNRLMARAAADRVPGRPSADAPPDVIPIERAPGRPSPRRFSATQWLASAAAVLLTASVAYYGLLERDRNRDLQSQVHAMASARDALQRDLSARDSALAQAEALIAGMTGPGVQVIDARAPGIRAPSARMFWDRVTNSWTFIAHDLPAVPAGRTYQLWLITRDQHKVSAGTFAVRPGGDAVVRATYALARDSLFAVAVTEEPAGGSPQPTTTPLLVGVAKAGD
jgi:anti-sigma factor RsiW